MDRFRWMWRIANRAEAIQLRWLGTSGLSLLGRTPVLLLETTGRKTGRRRRTPVAYWEDGDGSLLIGGGAAGMSKVDWIANLTANPEVRVWLRRRSALFSAERLSGADYHDVRQEALQRWPNARRYEARSGRMIPYFRLRRSV